MPTLGPWELIVILLIVVVIFGAGRLAEIGGAVGKSVREFRHATQDPDQAAANTAPATTTAPAASAAPATTTAPAASAAPAATVAPAAENKCPSCATVNPAGQAFCGQCGTRLTRAA
jgi:sec-independent protein translocase protein TatA